MLTITITFFMTLILSVIISIFIGVEKTVSALPVIFTFSLVISLFGFIIIKFFPIILIFVLIYYIKNRNKIKKTKFYYRRYSEKDFEDLFRNQTYNEYGKGNYYYKKNSQNTREKKDKYCEILGVRSNATIDEIKKAYRELAKKHHPDKYVNHSQEIKDFHEKRFKEINEAYKRLTQ